MLMARWLTPNSAARSTCRSPPIAYLRRTSLACSGVNFAFAWADRCWTLRPLLYASLRLVDIDPRNRCRGLQQALLSHRCSTNLRYRLALPSVRNPVCKAMPPRDSQYATRCACTCFPCHDRLPYPDEVRAPCHSQHSSTPRWATRLQKFSAVFLALMAVWYTVYMPSASVIKSMRSLLVWRGSCAEDGCPAGFRPASHPTGSRSPSSG